MKNIDKPFSISGKTYDSTLTVVQKDENFLTEESIQQEVFARNIGLVYKKYKVVKKHFNPSNPDHDSIVSGSDFSYKMNCFGFK